MCLDHLYCLLLNIGVIELLVGSHESIVQVAQVEVEVTYLIRLKSDYPLLELLHFELSNGCQVE